MALVGNVGLEGIETMNELASVLESEGKEEEAETVMRSALELCKKLPVGGHPTMATLLLRLGRMLEMKGDLPGAETVCRQVVEMRRKLLGHHDPYVSSALGRLACVLLAAKQSSLKRSHYFASAWRSEKR